LNALGHRAAYAKVVGSVVFGGRALTPEDLVYVPQFDEFNANLTVYEQVRVALSTIIIDVDSVSQLV